jgi:uncharacterized membrane protein YedE/YeeE
MPAILAALAAGLIFGLGLTVSSMIAPAKVLGFLDLFGDWDPSLAFVMGAAVPIAAIGFVLARKRTAPVLAPSFELPTATRIDSRLMGGAALFGLGWGLVGLCPGPAVAGLAEGHWGTLLFVIAMVAGMAAFDLLASHPGGLAVKES